MAMIDMLKWDTSNDQFAWKHPEQNLSTFTQLIVHETQEAVLFSKGKLMGKFGPGKHTLDTENLPILRSLFGLPFGGKNPFTAEVWYVNKVAPLNIPWTTDAMRYMDPGYGVMVPVRAEGQYGLQITDAEKFLLKLVGTVPSFDSRALTAQFRGELISKTKSTIMAKMTQEKISVLEISGYLSGISDYLKQIMTEFWSEVGFRLNSFYVTSIDVDNSTAEGQKIIEAMTSKSARQIEGYTYQQERSFDTMQVSPLAGIGLGLGVGAGMAGSMATPGSAPGTVGASGLSGVGMGTTAGASQVFCAKCGTKTGGAKFCPSCGKGYNPCPGCGGDNLADAVKCVMCSRPLGKACTKCKAPLALDAKFCPNCGNTLKKTCGKCGTVSEEGVKFCPNCGSGL
ncbi:MAG: SPFH domain-containing protein [Spirochaetales bacterium]